MSGRKLFAIFYPVFVLISIPLYILPVSIVNRLWIFLDLFPGLLGVGFRYAFAMRMAKKIGKNVFFGRGVEVLGWKKITFGDNVSIHKDCYLDGTGELEIGNDVSIAHNSTIMTFDHTWDDSETPIRSNPLVQRKVTLHDDVWIGCGCRILSGVEIGSRSIVAAGAVVNKDIEAGSLVGGVPAKLLKRIA